MDAGLPPGRCGQKPSQPCTLSHYFYTIYKHTHTYTHPYVCTLVSLPAQQCSYCMKEAQYNCCWNANYCNETCQQAHWPEHMKNCVQARQSASTPATEPHPPTSVCTATPTDPQAFVFAQPPRPSSTGNHIVMPHATPPVAMATQQSPREVGGASESILQYAGSAQTDGHSEHAGLERAVTRIEQVPNDTSILTSVHHHASQHMKNLLLQQAVAAQQSQHALQQQPAPQQGSLQSRTTSNKNTVISGGIIRPSVSLYQSPVVDSATARDSSPHCLAPGLPPPASPGSPAAEQSSVHNPPGFSWPYQQPVIISSTDGYPMMPALQSTGNQPQHQQPFFKAF